MRKADTAARKAKSTRNRHNGRVNAYKDWILNHSNSEIVKAMCGRDYVVLETKREIPQNTLHLDEESAPPLTLTKTQMVRI